jgi:hypothetical protein
MSKYRKNPESLDTTVGQSQVVFNVESLKYFALSDVASRIWELINTDGVTADEVVTALLQEYDVPAEECHKAVESFLHDALLKGLIVVD